MVWEIETQMPVDELRKWIQFSAVEPIGDARGDLRAGLVAASVMNSQGARKKATDFMPFLHADHTGAKAGADSIAARVHRAFSKATSKVAFTYLKREKKKAE